MFPNTIVEQYETPHSSDSRGVGDKGSKQTHYLVSY